MKKRILSIITVLLITITSIGTAYAAKGEGWDDYWYNEDFESWDKSELTEEEIIRLNAISENSYADLDVDITRIALPNDSEKALRIIEFFKEIGVLSQSYNVYDVITRAQAAGIIANLLNYNQSFDLFNGTTFDDVTPGDFACNEISYVHIRGIMSGIQEKIFAPDEYFYYDHAIASLIRMLGYEAKATAKGGYPTGYKITATDLGILKGTNRSSNTDLIGMGAFCTMLVNCFEIPMIDSYLSKDDNYVLGSNSKTILEDCLEMRKSGGVVSAVENIDLYGFREQLKEDEIKINDVVYTVNNIDYKQFLGKKVEFYTEKEKEGVNPQVLYMEVDSKVKEVTLFAHDIKFKSTNVIEKENEDGKNTEYKISGSANILYNGIPVSGFTSDLIPKSGRVVLISNDGTKNYNVVLIYDYKDYVAMGVSDTKVLFEYNDTITVDGKSKVYLEVKDENTPYSVLKNGKYVKLKNIEKGSAVCVAYSDNVGYIIETCDEYVEGEIAEISSNPYTITIDDKSYEVSSNYLELVKNNAKNAVDFEFGMYAKFIVNPFGMIVGMTDAEADEMQYGFVLGVLKGSGFNTDVKIKLFSITDNKVKEYDFKDKVVLNGATVSKSFVYDDVNARLNTFNTGWNLATPTDEEIKQTRNTPPIVKFKTVKKDVIGTMVTSVIDNTDDETMQDNNIVRHVSYSTLRCFQQYRTLGRKILFDDTSTYALKVPDSLEEKDFISGRIKNVLPAGNDTEINVVSFDSDRFDVPELVIWYGAGGGALSHDHSVMVVDSVASGVDASGEKVGIIRGTHLGLGNVEYYTLSDDDLMKKVNTLKKGDAITIATTDKNEIRDVQLNVRYGETTIYNYTDELKGGNTETAFGEIVEFDEKFIKLKSVTNGQATTNSNQMKSTTKLYFFDGEKIYAGSYTDIEKGDLLFTKCYLTNLNGVIVYKQN